MNENNHDDLFYSPQQTAVPTTSFINKVYGTMTLGLLVTTFAAHYAHKNIALNDLADMMFPCLLGEIVLALVLSFTYTKMPTLLVFLGFIGYAALNGITLSSIFFCYKLGSVAQAFLTASCTFAAMTILGCTTKKDLTKLGNLCLMAIIGIVIAGIFNYFCHSTGLDFAISALGVIIFVGLTAYDTQKIKKLQEAGCNHSGVAIMAALQLYLDFINLFLYLLRLFGKDNDRD